MNPQTHTRTTRGLDALFTPASVAVIGASDNPGRIGGRVLARFVEHFSGPIYAVNANRDIVQGRPCSRTIADLPQAPDLAVLAIPAKQVLTAVEGLAEIGCQVAIVLSSGFAELGDEGRRHQEQLRDVADRTGMRIIGPNCVGSMSIPSGVLATFADLRMRELQRGDRPGIGIVSQSGALGAVFFQAADALGLHVNYVCTTGNEADVSAAEAISALVERPDVNVLMVFLEALRDPETLYAAGRRALELGKPIVAMKVGVSETGAMAAASHSGSLAAPDRFAESLLERSGIIRAESPIELLNMTAALAGGRVPAGDRVAVMTLSGGVGIMIADELDQWGLTLPRTGEATAQKIQRLIPPYGSTRNPIDYTANAVNNAAGFAEILEAVITDDDFDMVVINGLSMATFDGNVAAIQRLHSESSKPMIVSMSGPGAVAINERGVPCISDAVQAAKAMGALNLYRTLRSTPPSEPPLLGAGRSQASRSRTLEGNETRSLLTSYGVPFVPEHGACGPGNAAEIAETMGFPVAVKLDPSVSAHKTEVGGIRLNLGNAEDVRSAVIDIQSNLGASDDVPFVVQRMVEPGLELTVGAIRDDTLGPAVLVGLGGVTVEILDEIEMALVPVNTVDAERMIRRLCGGRLTTSTRGLAPAIIRALSEVVASVSALMAERRDVIEVDVNPLIVQAAGLVAVDALVRVADFDTVSDG